MNDNAPHVLILGAGINGCALARELVLSGVGVTLVDIGDVACGTSAYSSRLVHGGLRYLEYREFDLVRESLHERTRLLQLAPQFVRPLRLYIPTSERLGGVVRVASNFLGLRPPEGPPQPRGMWLVRTGLWMYDEYARDPTLPKHARHRVGEPGTVSVDPQTYRWLLSYSDAQIVYPERFIVALLEDARRLAAGQGIAFELYAYHHAVLKGRTAEIHRGPGVPHYGTGSDEAVDVHDEPVARFEPDLIVNATGAWVDETLRRLHVAAPRKIAGTKGSHFYTLHNGLREAIGDQAIYVEAADGRPVFILSFLDGVLVGTTDIHYDGDPAQAIASDEELDYLVQAVNNVVPDVNLTRDDLLLHYCGVRPLPSTRDTKTGAIPRGHWMEETPGCAVPLYSIIGGKLTTCRALAQTATATLVKALGREVVANSEHRPIPGGEGFPDDRNALQADWQRTAARFLVSDETARAAWRLLGSRADEALAEAGLERLAAGDPARALVAGTAFPRALVRWSIEHEQAHTLEDLVERRLMLLYDADLTQTSLRELADELVATGRIAQSDVPSTVGRCAARLASHFGRTLPL